MGSSTGVERFPVAVIGGGQAGLAVGYCLHQRGVHCVILDANARIGDSWRHRWDSLRLFTPAAFSSIPGLPFPSSRYSFPTKDMMADYLEQYAQRFSLPVRAGVRVDRLSRNGGQFVLTCGAETIEADQVVVAMSNFQLPRIPPYADGLAPGIVQLHSRDYRNPSQLRDGPVLIVGTGNSGAEIAREISLSHPTIFSGRDVGEIPFDPDGWFARRILVRIIFRLVFHRILTLGTPIGRKVRPKVIAHGGPRIRAKWKTLAAQGVRRAPRVRGVQAGKPVLEDGQVLDIANVIWCTGFQPGFSWIDLPVFENGEPVQTRGVVEREPGLYFVGLHFQYAFSSAMIHGLARDAEFVADALAARAKK